MLSSISNFPNVTSAYDAQSSMSPAAKVSVTLQGAAKAAYLDTYERADGSTATRKDLPTAETAEKPESEDDQKFREVLHQFVGQTLFGQMLKSMRATQEKNPYFHGGRAEEIFQSQLDMVLTEKLTQASSKTISEPMYKLMKKQ